MSKRKPSKDDGHEELDAKKADGISRREFTKKSLQAGIVAGAVASGVTAAGTRKKAGTTVEFVNDEYEYVIVGSGAGGGPLACNLVKAGHTVLVLEAGDNDPSDDIHNIPAWHALSSEDDKLSWDFFVKHYGDPERQQRDSKFVPGKGILYPRASTIGGCTTHHAMITCYPHNNDFDRIAQITGDDSWDSSKMRRYFERLERCQYLPRPFFRGSNVSRHGFEGWLRTNYPDLRLLFDDPLIIDFLLSALGRGGFNDVIEKILSGNLLDINDWRVADGGEGAFITPMAVDRNSQRRGVREYLMETQARYPDRLHIRTNALATRVLFNEKTAVGVEYREGKSLYRADPLYDQNRLPGALKEVRATREVILASGAFNSPQLLKLSGIGPAAELKQHGIDVLVDLPGVGENLQDRYEIGVVSDLNQDLPLSKDCTFGEEGDPCLARYKRRWWDKGPYTSNGLTLAMVSRSKPDLPEPDLFVFGLPGNVHGYFPGYSNEIKIYKNRFTWLVLKAHTKNTAGRVTLRSSDPQDTPDINFHYFEEGNDASGDDLRSTIQGVKTARKFMQGASAQRHIVSEVYPGAEHQTDEEIGEFIKNESWGHHASCTNKIGAAGDSAAVLDTNFQVYGTKNLRVVDASAFPYIPGYFIVVPTYMLSEKASDAILATARQTV